MLLYRYIIKAHIGPFVFALSVVIFLFLFQFIYKSLDQLLGKGISTWVITQLITLNLAWMLTLAVPMAVLVATIMAFGSIASNNEITAMKAGGISLKKLMIPVLLISGILCYMMIRFNNDVLPEANHQARVLFSDITRSKPTLILEAGKFSEDISGARILVNKTFPENNNLEGVYIYDYSNPLFKNLFIAEKGSIGFSSDLKNIVMDLNEGEIHQYNIQDPVNKYRRIKFEKHRIILPAEDFGFRQNTDGNMMRGDREMTSDQMRIITDSLELNLNSTDGNYISNLKNIVNELAGLNFKDTIYKLDQSGKNNPTFDSLFNIYKKIMTLNQSKQSHIIFKQQIKKQIDAYSVEIYKKFSIPFACIIFALIGAPLGYKVKKGGFGVAAGLSLLFFLIYWASLIGGEKLADRGLVSPFIGMWIANILLGVFGLYLMFKSS
ncbi:MAG TPA: LptF/LptG family permease [Ignavibacteria bacterium]|nr:LptF/LptG family permease [Ignavibacteria bacterium]